MSIIIIKMGCDVSHLNVLVIVEEHCHYPTVSMNTTFKRKGESRWNRTDGVCLPA